MIQFKGVFVSCEGTAMRLEVKVGDAFNVEAVEVEDIESVKQLSEVFEQHREMRMREIMTYVGITILIVSLGVSALVGVIDGSFNELKVTWSLMAAPMGYLFRGFSDRKR